MQEEIERYEEQSIWRNEGADLEVLQYEVLRKLRWLRQDLLTVQEDMERLDAAYRALGEAQQELLGEDGFRSLEARTSASQSELLTRQP